MRVGTLIQITSKKLNLYNENTYIHEIDMLIIMFIIEFSEMGRLPKMGGGVFEMGEES